MTSRVRFGTYHVFQCPPGQTSERVIAAELDDPDGCAEKITRLRDAGIERLLLWMGPGGVRHDLLVRSMRLFAEEVMPRFR